ncbi:MAG: hypothetical protein QF745_03465 [Planctomycetota bacterium]|nr:hypothetical protein [Planctomycetota bacterium]
MGCEREHEYLLYLWGEMDQAQRAAFVGHLEQCPVCKGRIKQLELLVGSMRQMEVEELPEEVSRRVSSQLAEANENRSRAVLAVAASIVLVVGVSILWLNSLNKSPGLGGRVETTKLALSGDDYVEALALVLISEPDNAYDTLTEAIEDVAYQITELSQDIEDDFEPIEPNKEAPNKQGASRVGGKVGII